jgi:hypothetical protein
MTIQTETRTRTGTTAEGLPCEVNLVYSQDAPEGAKPLHIYGWYLATDTVPGETDAFAVDDARDLPEVVSEGQW